MNRAGPIGQMSSFAFARLARSTVRRLSISPRKHPFTTTANRAMSTKTIAVLDQSELEDGQMYLSMLAALRIN